MLRSKDKLSDTGYDLSSNESYTVTLVKTSPLFDLDVACDFNGWNPKDLEKKQLFHKTGSFCSRFRGKKLFTLVGEVGGQQIDLGALWEASGKGSFKLDLQTLFPEQALRGRLYTYFNDVHGFYWNNKGTYEVHIETLGHR